MAKARKYVLRSHFSGLPKREDVEIVEEELPALQDGEFLCEALWLSVDPYIRVMSAGVPLGNTVPGSQIAKVIESKNQDFPVGELVVGIFGWRTLTISDGKVKPGMPFEAQKLDPNIHTSPSTALGILGATGATAYFGFVELCKPKEGETLVVTAAAGAVGSAVGQIAKIKGCRVVGFAGSDEKVEYLKSIGFDVAYNYKTVESLDAAIKTACPNGVDIFFDCVGGEFFEVVLANMNTFGRASVCGAISLYNTTEPPKCSPVSPLILSKQLKVEGFIVGWWLKDMPEALKEIYKWIQEGKLTYREHVIEGFDHTFDAFLGLFKGNNIGKSVVKA